MFSKMYRKITERLGIRKIFSWVSQFIKEKPQSRISSQWGREVSLSSKKEQKNASSDTSIYVPLQLNYFFDHSNSSPKSTPEEKDNWNLAAWMNLSQSLGDAYSPNLKG